MDRTLRLRVSTPILSKSGSTSNLHLPSSPPPSPLLPPLKRKKRKIVVEDDDVYIVESILARSIRRARCLNGSVEYWYLVRWEGYTSKDDTWESYSNLIDGASDLMREFESRDHPFTILNSRGMNPPMFQIRYGVLDPSDPSGKYQTVWHGRADMRARGDISSDTIERVIKSFQNRAGYSPPSSIKIEMVKRPMSTKRANTSLSGTSDRFNTPRSNRSSTRESEPTLLDKECVLLAVLDREKRSAPKRHYDYKIRYRHGNKIQEEWMDYKTLYKFFDRPTFRLHVQQYIQNPVISLTDLSRDDKRKRQEEIEKSKGRGGLASEENEYELERKRNIEANREMMRSLGLLN